MVVLLAFQYHQHGLQSPTPPANRKECQIKDIMTVLLAHLAYSPVFIFYWQVVFQSIITFVDAPHPFPLSFISAANKVGFHQVPRQWNHAQRRIRIQLLLVILLRSESAGIKETKI